MSDRFRRAAVDVFSRPALYWAIAGLFWLRVVVLTVLTPRRPDTEGMWEGAHAYLTNPSHMYEPAADYLRIFHVIAPPGRLNAFVSPPPIALLAAPVAFLPKNIAVEVWTTIDAAAIVLALVLLFRLTATAHPFARPVFWLVAGYFPPLFADVSAGQRGGVLFALAMASVWFERNRPLIAGALGGVAASLKYFPAAMIIGPRPQHRARYAVALVAALLLVTVATFIPLGLSGGIFYYQHVLLPSLGSSNVDCAFDSVPMFFARMVGGEPYVFRDYSINGYSVAQSPLHLPLLASVLSYLSAIAFAAGAVWGAWRSGWHPAYGMSLGFALGALIPNEVWPYQWLPLLPVVLLVFVRSIEQRHAWTTGLLGVCLLGFIQQPCLLFFPHLWTLAAVGLFVICVWENRLFRTSS